MTVVVPSYLVRQMALTCEFQKTNYFSNTFSLPVRPASGLLLEFNYNENEVCLLKLLK